MKENQRSLSLNAFLNSFRTLINLIFPLITFPYVSRTLSVKSMGIFNFSNTYIGYFILIAGLGVSTYAVREGAKYRDEKEKINNFCTEVFSINIISSVLSYCLLILSLLVFVNLKNYVSCILVFSIQIIFTTIGAEWVYVIFEDYAYITVRSIIFKIISLLLLFIFVKGPNDYLSYSALVVFSTVGSNILNYIHLRKFVTVKVRFNHVIFKHLKPIFTIFAASVAVNIYVFSDNTLLGLIKNDYAVGIYSVAVKIYTITQSLLTAILMVTIPRLAMLFGKRLMNQYNNLLRQLTNMLVILVFPAAMGLIALSKEIVLIIAGNKYIPSIISLRIIALAIIFSIFSWIFSECVLIPAKREKYVFYSTSITAIFNVIFNIIFIPFGSYNVTALSTVLSEFLSMIINAYYGRDIIKFLFNKVFLKNVIDTLIGCLGIFIICSVIRFSITGIFIRVSISILLSILVYFGILLLLRNKEATNTIIYVLGKFHIHISRS